MSKAFEGMFIVGRIDGTSRETLVLSEEDMEWILNSLRATQEKQQELAGKFAGHVLTAQDIEESVGAEPPTGAEHIGYIDIVIPEGGPIPEVKVDDVFLEQHADVTDLRERLVKFIGRDLTDG